MICRTASLSSNSSSATLVLADVAPSPLGGEGWGEGLQGWGTTLTLALSLRRERGQNLCPGT